MRSLSSYLIVFGFTFIAWIISLGVLSAVKDIPRFWFIVVHYAVDILIFGIVFLIYYKNFNVFSNFTVMAIAMISLFIIEFVFWNFFYKGELWFFNFVDWVIPAFIVASTIYFTRSFVH